ncbi:hypothetical protein SAMN05421743_10564 [Thalassobacillus cyri]|uniref:Uncharacterized protein n=1 Tax=Thalassobacillus cyri TaxID=571932 RepID=A0A1H4BL67_9BACI|nr:hypothetical protein [Thalassobacillus cyri]SEA48562.1 hypothetical protein SAMN05421743_10564 [Thalassobacillus cyri]
MEQYFTYDPRLHLSIPDLPRPFYTFTQREQALILAVWENHRGEIPDKIKKLEKDIENCLARLNNEEDFEASCRLNDRISQLASMINDLWIWYRTNPVITAKTS